jgi:hypothetical protein
VKAVKGREIGRNRQWQRIIRVRQGDAKQHSQSEGVTRHASLFSADDVLPSLFSLTAATRRIKGHGRSSQFAHQLRSLAPSQSEDPLHSPRPSRTPLHRIPITTMVAPAIVLGLRGVQVLFSIIVLGLTAYLVDAYNGPYGYNWSPHSVNFMLFCSIWTLLAAAFLLLVPTRFPQFAHKFAIAAVEFITMIFWFAAFIAVAVRWNNSYWGWYGHDTFYSVGVAAIVFSAFLWYVSCSCAFVRPRLTPCRLTFVATTALSALHIRGTSNSNTAPPPNMAGV